LPIVARPTPAAIAIATAVPTITTWVAVAPAARDLSITGATPAVVIITAGQIVVLPAPGALTITGRRPAVLATIDEREIWAAGLTRIIRRVPTRVRPAAARLRLVMATPDVVIIDDGDFLAMAGLLA
jgi:hypothetical protein